MEKWHNTIINISFVTTNEFKKSIPFQQQNDSFIQTSNCVNIVRLWQAIPKCVIPYDFKLAPVTLTWQTCYSIDHVNKKLRITEQRISISPFKNDVVFSKSKYMNRISSHFILLKIMSDLNRATVRKDALLSAYYSVQTPSVRLCCILLSHIKLHNRI